MYSKTEASKIREAFWTKFGKYMAPVHSASSEQVNWINYKTGIKHIRFFTRFTNEEACAKIVITYTDDNDRKVVLKHFELLINDLDEQQEGVWEILDYQVEDGKPSAQIVSVLNDVNIFKQETWPAAISFLKARLISLNRFWASHKEIFEQLV